MSTIIDQTVDAPLQAIADLIEASIVAKWGRAALPLKATYTHEIQVAQLTNRVPALIVLRDSDQAFADHDVIDDETVTLVIEFYMPPTPPDRMPLRRPFLRNVWKRVHSRLCAGFDPLVVPHHINVAPSGQPENMLPVLATQGWAVPQRAPATVKYGVMSAQEGVDPMPYFRAVVAMRTAALYDWTFEDTYEHDDLERIRTTATSNGEPAFESETDF